ncbi:hypothetical protein ACLB2K_038062 [Fragaria x ananassa]
MIDVALAYLHHAYETTIVHFDLKPSNIQPPDDGMVAHAFGIAKLLGGGAASMSHTAPYPSYNCVYGSRYIAFGSSDAIVEVVDSDLIGTQEEVEDSFCEQDPWLVACEESPEERMNMQDTLATLNRMKNKFLKPLVQVQLRNFVAYFTTLDSFINYLRKLYAKVDKYNNNNKTSWGPYKEDDDDEPQQLRNRTTTIPIGRVLMARTGLFGPGINMGFILLGLKLSLLKTSVYRFSSSGTCCRSARMFGESKLLPKLEKLEGSEPWNWK